jgi:hypothetical protein
VAMVLLDNIFKQMALEDYLGQLFLPVQVQEQLQFQTLNTE